MIEKLINRKVTTSMIYLGIVLIGVIALQKLPVQLLPNIEFPKLTVITPYENAAPSEIEKLVTRYIEEAVSSVNGVVSVYSESIEGLSLVTARFEWGTDMDMAVVETKEKVDMIKGQLPQDTDKSIVVKFDPKAEPIMIYSVASRSDDFRVLRRRVEKEILPYLERIPGVAMVDVSGGYKRQVNIDIDGAKIYAHNLSLPEVLENVNMANYNFPAGTLEKETKEYLVRTIGEFKSVSEINKVVIGRNDNGVPVYLKDIGTVTDAYKDRKSIIRLNGREAVALLIRKEPGKNTVETCGLIEEKMAELRGKYGSDFTITNIYAQSDFINSSVDSVFYAAVLGGIISFFILWFFLKEIRSPLIIATSIPISIIGTFGMMYFLHISINTMSLGGLALGVGMMVDSGIVVLESIAEKHKRANTKNASFVKAVVEGTKEVVAPVVSSIITNIVVFLPIVFLAGLSGAVFGEMALTITISQFFSLLSAVTLIPMLYTIPARLGRKKPTLKTPPFPGLKQRVFDLSDRSMGFLHRWYGTLIDFSLKNRRPVLAAGIGVLSLGLLLFAFIDSELMPRVDPGEFAIDIETMRGTTLEESASLSGRIERYIMKKPYVRFVHAQIGSDPEESIVEKTSGRGSHNILIQVFLTSGRRAHVTKIVDSLRKELKFGDNVNIDYLIKEDVIASIFSHKRKPVHIEAYGRDLEVLKQIGNEIKRRISSMEGIRHASTLFDQLDPELKIEIDRNKMSSLGIRIADAASTVRAAVNGEVATQFREKDDEIDVRVRLQKSDRTEKESLGRMLVKTATGAAIPLGKFADIVDGLGSSKIIRNEQSRVNIITADIAGDKDRILGKVEDAIASMKMREGYEAKLIDEKTEIMKTLKEMRFAFILAVILIYMVIAAQFQSFRIPLIIMLSIPVASLGISGSLLLTGKTLNINSGIGIIMLAGIAVNNAIVLFSYIENSRMKGTPIRDAIIEAGTRRLKPILMTTLTTAFGLLPIALGIGEGSELQQPLAISVFGGLIFSTALTLIFIPTVYVMVTERREKSKARIVQRKEYQAGEVAGT